MPLFVENGDKIEIDTRTHEYQQARLTPPAAAATAAAGTLRVPFPLVSASPAAPSPWPSTSTPPSARPFACSPACAGWPPGAPQLTPLRAAARATSARSWPCCRPSGRQALLARPGFDAAPALRGAGRARRGRTSRQPAAGTAQRAEALRLGCGRCATAEVEQTAPGRFGLGDEVGALPARPAAGLAPGRPAEPGLRRGLRHRRRPQTAHPLAGRGLPSHWAPEDKVGRHFAAGACTGGRQRSCCCKAGDALTRLVTGAERWERFVWTVTDQPRLHAHPARVDPQRWPPSDADAWPRRPGGAPSARPSSRVPDAGQAVFTIQVEVQPLAEAIDHAEHGPARCTPPSPR